ncbi:alpha/beta hydrolase [Aeromicrobium sp. PE09-221]|uniref:alpha/beta hydrolase n=1 Tax=Aeromicrobium sp. PE09-221 TaxID=1898043 RepID=UPI000B3EB997|nr:alpha/beta hydrolase [Aeromicrobium sp. PE09-221]OUZ10517.1 alpha/beta hydrolase [Aeromicrobium sp. PE09-221]
MPLDPQLTGLLDLVNAGPGMPELGVDGARAAMRALTVDARTPDQVIPVGSVEETVIVERPARVYRPETSGPAPTVLFLHGGGWVVGDLDTHDNAARAICRGAEAVVVSLDYRLAPEHPFPAAADDAVTAAEYLATRLDEYGGDDRFGVAGDSAGGNLAAIAAQRVPTVTAQFLIYPAVDPDPAADYPSRAENAHGYFLDAPTMAWFMEQYAPGTPPVEDPRYAPLRAESLEGLAPAVVLTAEFDPLRDEGEAYAAALEKAGVPVILRRYDGLIHGFLDMGMVSRAAQEAVDESIVLFADVLRS